MNPTRNFREAVDEALNDLQAAASEFGITGHHHRKALASIQEAAAEMVLELIGENERPLELWEDNYHERMIAINTRDALRAELRAKAQELRGSDVTE